MRQQKKIDHYRVETNRVIKTLQPDNQDYLEDLQSYLLLSGFCYDEQVLLEQLYQLSLDVSDAEKDGISAEVFLGRPPKEMADDLLSMIPKSKKTVAGYALLIACISCYCKVLLDFGSSRLLTINLFSYGLMILLEIVAIYLVFHLLAASIYTRYKKLRLCIVGICLTSFIFGLAFLPTLFSSTFQIQLSFPLDALFLLVMSGGVGFVIWREKTMRCLLVLITSFLVSGLSQRYLAMMQIEDKGFTVFFPFLVTIVCTVLYFFISYVQVKEED